MRRVQTREHLGDERALRVGVGGAVAGVERREVALELGVRAGERGVGPQGVAEGEVVAPEGRAVDDGVEVDRGSVCRGGSREVAALGDLALVLGLVAVAERGEPGDLRFDRREVGRAEQEVEDRLRGEVGDGRAADVLEVCLLYTSRCV